MKAFISVIREPKNKQLNQVAGEKEGRGHDGSLKSPIFFFFSGLTEKSRTWITRVPHYYIYLSILPFDTLVKLSVCIVSAFRFFLFGHQVTDMRRNLYLFTKCLSEDY